MCSKLASWARSAKMALSGNDRSKQTNYSAATRSKDMLVSCNNELQMGVTRARNVKIRVLVNDRQISDSSASEVLVDYTHRLHR